MITGIRSVGVPVSDQDRAVDFFVTKLGFTKRRDEGMDGDARWIEVAPEGAETVVVPFVAGLIFVCDDLQATYEELRSRDVEFTQEPSEQSWGRWAQFRDPDGNEYGLVQQS